MEKIIIFAAPSGSGKTTISKHLISKYPDILQFSISATNRAPRGEEVDGKDYHFITTEQFQDKIKNEEFIEWEEVYANRFYGTLKSEVERVWKEGKIVVFDMDVKGGVAIKEIFKNNALSIFVYPPSFEVLEERLRLRSTETEDDLQIRLAKTKLELEYHKHYDIVLVNDILAESLVKAENIVNKFINISVT